MGKLHVKDLILHSLILLIPGFTPLQLSVSEFSQNFFAFFVFRLFVLRFPGLIFVDDAVWKYDMAVGEAKFTSVCVVTMQRCRFPLRRFWGGEGGRLSGELLLEAKLRTV